MNGFDYSVMIDNKARYKYFKDNEAKIWKSRFAWHGEHGDGSYPNINVVSFLKEHDIDFNAAFKAGCFKVSSMFNVLDKMANEYVAWSFMKNKNFIDLYPEDDTRLEGLRTSLRNHFIGCIGEFFFCFLLNDRKEFLVPYNIGDREKTMVNFSNVSPRLDNEDDFGVDLVGDIEYIDQHNTCAIQVKFWRPVRKNPDSTAKERMFTNDMASGVYTDGVLNGFIDNDSKKSLVVCWTLKEENLSRWLLRNTKLSSKMMFIDMSTLHTKIDGKSPEFWSQLKENLNTIKSY